MGQMTTLVECNVFSRHGDRIQDRHLRPLKKPAWDEVLGRLAHAFRVPERRLKITEPSSASESKIRSPRQAAGD